MSADGREGFSWTRGMVAWTLVGVALRLAALLAAGDLEPYADESNYLYLALTRIHFGVYSDCALYLWPPGYPLLVAAFLDGFGSEGLLALKLFQVLLSGIVGFTVMLLARRLFGGRAASIAGALWCLHVPLIGFTHTLWPETVFLALFLPGVALFLSAWLDMDREPPSAVRLLVSGLLLGLSLTFKEVALYWCVILGGLIVWRGRHALSVAWTSAAIFLLAVTVVVLPFGLRNYEVYGRFAAVGSTLGQNVYFGINTPYFNFDYPPDQALEETWLTAPVAEPWPRSEAPNVLDAQSRNVERGLRYALEHPGFAARTRVQKLADWATPLSFFVRHHAMGLYHGALDRPIVRRPMLLVAILVPLLLLLGAAPGFAGVRVPGARTFLAWTLLYFVAVTALVNGISRYRIVVEPWLLVLTAGFLSELSARSARIPRSAKVAGAVSAAVLAGLWAINFDAIRTCFARAW